MFHLSIYHFPYGVDALEKSQKRRQKCKTEKMTNIAGHVK